MQAEKFDAIVVGAGQGGKPLAAELAGAGWKVALIEREHVGGTCINVGCTPTKTMAASARVAYLARRAADYGVKVGEVRVDQEVVRKRKRDIVESFRDGATRRLQKTDNLDLVFGTAAFEDAKTLVVKLNDGGERRMTAPKIVIDTGGRPLVPKIPGLDSVPFLDSTSVMELDRQPERLVVIGGGYIGLEFGQMFRRFGSEVTIVQRDERLVPREDEDIAEAVRKVLEQDGIEIETSADVKRVARAADGGVEVTFERDGRSHAIAGSHLLVAIGRKPNTEDLALDRAGVKTDDKGQIEVDDALATSVDGIFALGDVKGGPAFTHISYDDYRVLRDRWLHGKDTKIDGRLVPNTMFIDPQLAQVGLTERQARERKLDIRVVRHEMSGVARAIEMDETRGLIKVIVDARTGRILGCAVLGIEGGEIMAVLQVAMMGDMPYTVLKEAIFAHPTLAEGLNNVFLALDKQG